MLVVLNEHAVRDLRIKSLAGDAGQEFLRDTAAIDASFNSIKLVNEADLDGFLQFFPKLVEISICIFEDASTMNLRMMTTDSVVEGRPAISSSSLGAMDNRNAPKVRIDEAIPPPHLVSVHELTENLDPCLEWNEER